MDKERMSYGLYENRNGYNTNNIIHYNNNIVNKIKTGRE